MVVVCVHVVGRAFLLYVLEILLIQFIHTNTQRDGRVDGQGEEYLALLELTRACSLPTFKPYYLCLFSFFTVYDELNNLLAYVHAVRDYLSLLILHVCTVTRIKSVYACI